MHVTACLATLPTREREVQQAVASLLPQVDEVCVFFDQLPKPEAARRYTRWWGATGGKVRWAAGDVGDGGKFHFVQERLVRTDFVLTCDDDLAYPQDYVATLLRAWKTERIHQGKPTLVGVHAATLRGIVRSYRRERTSLRPCLGGARADNTRCNVLGTGTLGFAMSDLRDLRQEALEEIDFTEPRCVADLHVACWGQRHALPFVSIARPKGWLRYLLPSSAPTIWSERNTAREDVLVRGQGAWKLHGKQPIQIIHQRPPTTENPA